MNEHAKGIVGAVVTGIGWITIHLPDIDAITRILAQCFTALAGMATTIYYAHKFIKQFRK